MEGLEKAAVQAEEAPEEEEHEVLSLIQADDGLQTIEVVAARQDRRRRPIAMERSKIEAQEMVREHEMDKVKVQSRGTVTWLTMGRNFV